MSKMVARVIQSHPVQKSDTSEQLYSNTGKNVGDWISNPYGGGFQLSLRRHVEESIILPQCIRAYASNITGFGIGIRYKDEFQDEDETEEMKAEWDLLKKQIAKLNIRQSYKEIFDEAIDNRETYGIAYLEVIRDVSGQLAYISNIQDVPYVSKTIELDPVIPYSVFFDGDEIKITRKFKKYKQEVNGNKVYFKEFGDPRIMDKRTGKYANTVPRAYRANEIIEIKIGTRDYGLPRWYGQMLGVDGSRRAEILNRNYFLKGRHTPMLIAIEGGSLSNDSYAALQQYMNSIEGENGQHSFLLLETERKDGEVAAVSYGDEKAVLPKVEVKDLAATLQKDELFQDYIDNSRRRVQSSFNLPDVYVGYTTDYNRATVLAAMQVTEDQVFGPQREKLDWVLNHQLFAELNLKYCEAYFKAPDLTNVDDIVNLMNAANNAGGVTPNKSRDILYKFLGETAEPFPEEWGDIPLVIYNASQSVSFDLEQLEKSIRKAADNHDDDIVVVMKEVKKAITAMMEKVESADE